MLNVRKTLAHVYRIISSLTDTISLTVNRANRLVGLIKCSFSYMYEETLLVLYKTLVRPILDYGNTIWFPILKKDIRSIENIQRRITKLLPELSQLSYKERLQS